MSEFEHFTRIVVHPGRDPLLQIVSRNAQGAISFDVHTPWMGVAWDAYRNQYRNQTITSPWSSGVEQHVALPPETAVDSSPSIHECDLVHTGRCRHDGSSLAAEHAWNALQIGGTDAVYAHLDEVHRRWFRPDVTQEVTAGE